VPLLRVVLTAGSTTLPLNSMTHPCALGEQAARVGLITNVVVHSELRHKGVGRQLVLAAHAEACYFGCVAIEVELTSDAPSWVGTELTTNGFTVLPRGAYRKEVPW
jgi:N-acetylglutamate synthase-like GNAT family acetyltransferase